MTDKRVEKSSTSTIALRDLLKKVCQNPESFANDKVLRDALSSQGGLAKYSNIELDIRPTSINTLKRVCTEVVDGGFKSLDDLRKGALERIDEHEHREKTSNKRTRTGLVMRVEELEQSILKLKQSNHLLTQALYEVISDIKSVANIEDEIPRNRRSQEAIKKLTALMSVKQIKSLFDPDLSNVIHLNPKR